MYIYHCRGKRGKERGCGGEGERKKDRRCQGGSAEKEGELRA